MTGLPVLQTQFEKHLWRTLNGGGPLGKFAATNGGPKSALEEVSNHDGTLSPGLLISLMDHLDAEGKATPETLREIVSRSRAVDCTPSVHAAMILLGKGDVESAEELLHRSDRSQEVLWRSVALARIRMRRGDREGAREAALRAMDADPSCPAPYEIMAEVEPGAGWPQMRNVQQTVDGEQPENPPGTGRAQELYSIYHQWFRGSREEASAMLARSRYYAEGDRDFLLASARMSVDEGDWHSARMMYRRLLDGAPPFLKREMAEACMDAGDLGRALELLSECDQTSPKTMLDIVEARHMAGDDAEAMVAMRAYLDSEWAGTDEYLDAVRRLIGYNMDAQASEVLGRYISGCGRDADALMLKSELETRAGDCMAALVSSSEAVMKEKGSSRARSQRMKVYLAMGDPVRAEKECTRVLADRPGDPDALHVKIEIQMGKGDYAGAAESCRRLLDDNPADVDALVSLAEALVRTDDRAGASDAAHRAVRIDGTRDVYVGALSALLAAGPNRDANYLCREAEARFPRDTTIKRIKGNIEYAGGDYIRASATFAAAAAEDPTDPAVWYSKGMADEARGDMESAEAAYDRALALDPGEPEYWKAKAAAREARGDSEVAMRMLDRAAELDRSDIYPVVRKAVILASESRFDESLHLLDAAEVMDPGNDSIAAERARVMEARASKAAESAPAPAPKVIDEEPLIPEPAERPRETPAPRREEPAPVQAAPVPAPVRTPEPEPEPEQVIEEKVEVEPAQAPEPVPEPEPAVEAEEAPVQEPEQELPAPEPEPEQETKPAVDRNTIDSMYSMAFSLEEAGDHKGALRTIDKALAMDPGNRDLMRLKAQVSLRRGDSDTAADLARQGLEADPKDADLHSILGQALLAKGEPKAALTELDTAVSLGADDADAHAARGDALVKLGLLDRATECYSAAVSRDPSRLDLAEKLARLMYARKESIAADGMLNRILRREPRRMSAILLKAEIAHSRNDEKALMAAYDYFIKCPNPGPENTVRMVRILEDSGHMAEAKELVVGKPQKDVADNSVKRHAEKALRRAYSLKVSPTDPDLISALGLDGDQAAQVVAYLSEQPDYGPINPGTDEFRRMEALSKDAVMKLGWKDLERNPRLPLEKVFVQCGCRDADEAKSIVAYVLRAMIADPGRNSDPRLSDLSMRLPKGISVYEIMRECDLGVYEARIVKNLIV